jgi:hypothetical protein
MGRDVSVGYNSAGDFHQINVTIYVYPTKAGKADIDILRRHYRDFKSNFLAYYKDAELVLEQEQQFEFTTGDRFGIISGFNLDMNNENKMSFLYLYGENKWFIKFRISYPASIHDMDNLSRAINNLISSFDYSSIR